MPGVMGARSFENFAEGEKVTKEYGKHDDDSKGGGGGKKFFKKPGSKRSFLQRTKKFEKQGKLGKGFEVDQQTFGYFVNVLDLLRKNEFEDDEDRETFVENSLSAAEKQESQLSSNQLVSRVIENILPLATEDKIHNFGEALTPNLRVVVCDAYASHVVEKLLEITSSDKWIKSETLTTWFEKTCKFVLNNFEDFTFDTYGSFVMKKVLECLSGTVNKDPNSEFIIGTDKKKGEAYQAYLYGIRLANPARWTILQDFAQRFCAWPQFNDLIQQSTTSRLLQNVLDTVSKTKDSSEIVRQIVTKILEIIPEEISATAQEHHVIEVCFAVVDPKMFQALYAKFFQGRLKEHLAASSITLQKLISLIPTTEIFKSIFDELSTELNAMIEERKIMFLHSLAAQCVKFNVKQKELWVALKNHLANGDKNMILWLLASEDNTDDVILEKFNFRTSYHGSQLVQCLMDFDNRAMILKHLGKLETDQLVSIGLDPKSSFILSKVFKSSDIPKKQQNDIFDKLKEVMVELAVTKFGSRLVDDIWAWATMSQKTQMAESLSKRIPQMQSNKFARFQVESMGLQTFTRSKKEWVEYMASQNRRKKLEVDIAMELGLVKGERDKNKPKTEVLENIMFETESPKKKKNKSKSQNVTLDTDTDNIEMDGQEPESQSLSTKKNKKDKSRKSEHAEVDKLNVSSMQSANEVNETQTPKKKKEKKRKSEAVDETNVSHVETEEIEETLSPKKKKDKKRKSKAADETNVSQIEAEEEVAETQTPKKKKNKKRKSEDANFDETNVSHVEDEEAIEEMQTPKRKKNKKRKSEDVNLDETNMNHIEENPEIDSRKKRKSKKHDDQSLSQPRQTTEEIDTPKKKKNKKQKSSAPEEETELEPILSAAQSTETETPKKKKNIKHKSASPEPDLVSETSISEEAKTPKNKKRKSQKNEAIVDTLTEPEQQEEETPKKKKKSRKSKA